MKKCHKCGKRHLIKVSFCSKCGVKLKELIKKKLKEPPKPKKEEKKEEPKKKADIPLKIVTLISTFIIILFLFLAPTRTYSYTVEVPYEDTEYYTETEPYDTQEAYQVQVPYESTEKYQDQVPVEVDVPYTDYETNTWTDYTTGCNWNTGCSCIDTSFWTGKCIKCRCSSSKKVTKYRTEVQYQTVSKTRPVTKYRTETKYRTVTKYKDVQKSRQVMKIRDEPRSYQINWIFKYRVPWYLHLPILSE